MQAFYTSPNQDFTLAQGDSFKLMSDFDFKFEELESVEARDNLTKHIDDLHFIEPYNFASEELPFYGKLPFDTAVCHQNAEKT